MPAALATFLTWTTYGTWLQGDARGSIVRVSAGRTRAIIPSPALERSNRASLKHEPTRLDRRQRTAVESAIRRVCEHRDWTLHAINVRSNHVHLVATLTKDADAAMVDLKAWSTRRLRADGLIASDRRVWTKHGSTRQIHNAASLAAAVDYVVRFQDRPRR
ncbi:MAG: transposase [Phycisphaerales bacterium]